MLFLKLSREASFRSAKVLKDSGALADAQPAFAKLYLECRDTLGIDHPDSLDALQCLADVVDAQVFFSLFFFSQGN